MNIPSIAGASPLVTLLLTLFCLSLAVSAAGFVRIVYFVSIGYAFSIAAMAVAAPILMREGLTMLPCMHSVLLLLYGLRLGSYLIARERRPAYKNELAEIQQRNAGVGLVKRVLIWVGVSVLYVMMYAPALFHIVLPSAYRQTAIVAEWVGLAVMAAGLALEAAADLQKSGFKRQNPKRFCDTGLYRFVRCPNYLGEIVFWTGNLAAAALLLHGWAQWLMALTGWVCIVLIMIGSTKRLEKKQEQRYGVMQEYREYIKKVPVLFPFIPIYSLKNVRVYLE